MNDGSPSVPTAAAADILRRLTGAATLAAGALLYGQATAQPATLALGGAGQVLVAGASAPAWSGTGLTYSGGNLACGGTFSCTTLTASTAINASAGILNVYGVANPYISLTDNASNIAYLNIVSGKMRIDAPTSGYTWLYSGVAPGTPGANDVFVGAGQIKAGAGISCTTLTASGLGSALSISNATSGWITYGQSGVGAPAYTTRSPGTKLVLYDLLSGSTADYAIGIESGAIWFGSSTGSNGFKWYAGTTEIASLTGAGVATFTGDIQMASGKVVKVNGTQVLAGQGAAVADATGAGDVVAQLNTLLARVRAHGLIAT